MQNSIARIEHLSHKYSSAWAIKDISFEINKIGVLGLLGSNGAGKSTTLNILCGVLNQTVGDIWINEINLRKSPERAKELIGFLPQVAPLYLDLTIDEYLTHCAYLRLMTPENISSSLKEVKERCGLTQYSKRLIRNLSGGYRQRVGIAQAIIHKPLLVVLDEATNGLDPIQILEVRKIIQEIGKERAVIFSSHILSEVQATCSNVLMIEGGVIVFRDSMEMFNSYIEPFSILIKLKVPPMKNELELIEGVTKVDLLDEYSFRIHYKNAPDLAQKVILLSVKDNWQLTEIIQEKVSLDQIFAQLSADAKKKITNYT